MNISEKKSALHKKKNKDKINTSMNYCHQQSTALVSHVLKTVII